MRVIVLIMLVVLPPLGLLAGCQSTPVANRSESIDQAPLQPLLLEATVLPGAFARHPPGELTAVRVPPTMLRLATVMRPQAQVRSGPGVQFNLEDFVFEYGMQVVMFDRVGVWQKVLLVDGSRKGWVHAATLTPLNPQGGALTLQAKDLPTVSAVHPIAAAKSYPAGEPLKVAIPKGAIFHALNAEGPATLVMLPETNSVMWISRKDVQ